MPKFELIPESIKKPARRVQAAADAAFLQYAQNEGPVIAEPWKIVLDSSKGRYARTKALFAAVRDMVPDGLFHQLTGTRYEFQGENISIDPNKYELEERQVGSGSENNVYKLTSLDPNLPSLVVKVDRTDTEDVDVLLERGKEVRREWETMKEWYQSVPGLVPDEFYFIGRSPIGGRNALITIQEYLGTKDELRDFFRDVSAGRLHELLTSDTAFRRDFIAFARVTIEHAEKYDEMIDTIGVNNLVLAERPAGAQLLLIDPHVIKHPRGTEVENERQVLGEQLTRLRTMLAEAEVIEKTALSPDTASISA
jgi:hypothetical protein